MCSVFKLEKMEDEKIRKSVWIHKSTLERVEDNWKKDDCRSRGEFIERAILNYVGQLETERNLDYLSPMIISSLKAITDESDERIMKLLFKNAVELAVMNNIMAFKYDIPEEDIKKVRRACVGEVHKLQGNFKLEDAMKWQRE